MPNSGKYCIAIVLLWVTTAWSVSTKFWTSATFEDFLRGSLRGISLSREGTMRLSPRLEEVFSTDQAIIWGVARDRKGNLYLGTGHTGKVFRLGPDLKGSLLFTAPEPEVFALAVDEDGNVFVGTSPEGKIYKVDRAGKGQEFFDPQAKYIWSLAFGAEGRLYVGTGDRGKIFRVGRDGAGELFYETNQGHVMSLAFSGDQELIAGTEPNGLLYRISANGKGFVLYDAPLSEIHSVAVGADGSIYASAMGLAPRTLRQGPPSQVPTDQPVLRTTTTVTVRAAQGPPFPGEGNPEGQDQPEQPGPEPDAQRQRSTDTAPLATPIPSVAGVAGGGSQATRSSVLRIWPDYTVETLWDSNRENVFGLLPLGETLLFSTDQKGRIYELSPERQVSLLSQTDQEEATRLIPFGDVILVTTANLGKVYRLGTSPGPEGVFESEVQDASNTSSWGTIRWTAELPEGTSVALYTRSGNSARPDATWSEWSRPYRNAPTEQIQSPAARYLQWKAVLRSGNGRSPLLREVTVAYLPKNRAPVVTEVKASSPEDRTPTSVSPGSSATISVGPGAANPRAFSRATPPSGTNSPAGVNLVWLASDPDEDELTYTLHFRGEGETAWKLLADNLKQNYLPLDNEKLADGKYQVKVVASDAGVNPRELAKSAEKISAPFLVDGTPPQVVLEEARRAAGAATVRFRALDATSVLTRAEYSLDAQPPLPLLSEDGVIDSPEEIFRVGLDPLDPGEHLLTLRVYDAAGNYGVGKAVLPATSRPEEGK